MEITTVRYTVETNNQVEITFDDASTYTQPYNEIRYKYTDMLSDWERGASQAWVADEAAYNDYRAIMDYDPASGDPAPIGYNSPEQVAESQTEHNHWLVSKDAWEANPENAGVPYPYPEPVILLSPDELPVVPPPSPLEEDLIPNTITPYYEYFNWSIAQAQSVKYGEGDSYSDELIDEANANPYAGYTTTPKKNKQRVAQRTKHNTNGKPPSDTDKDRDDALADREDEILDANDLLHDFIEAGTDVDEIMAVDIKTIVNWGSWTPSP